MLEDIQILTVLGQNAEAKLYHLRSECSQTGLYPVIFGEDSVFETIKSYAEFHKTRTFQTITAKSLPIDAAAWLREELQDFDDDGGLELGEWPTEPLNISDSLQNHLDLMTREVLPQVSIGLIPTKQSWEVFAALRWGGWNACPQPEEHCAIHRYWFEKYGVQIVGMTQDALECTVTKPPSTQVESLELAREHIAYNGDLDSSIETLSEYAATLLNAKLWHFWWD
jgi:Domain of unknown function (DUF4253)